MIALAGSLSLFLALLLAMAGAVSAFLGATRSGEGYLRGTRTATQLLVLLLLFANLALIIAFVTHDFSLRYVAEHSSQSLPLLYRVAAIWGGHAGSLLCCTLIFALWTQLASLVSSPWPKQMQLRVLAILLFLIAAFLLLLLWLSNPFAITVSPVREGRDLNPMLQNPALIVHPPLLYLGYIGLAIPYAMSIAALWEGSLDRGWLLHLRPWTVTSWSFLTAGIASGAWWAYQEAGWGGWWSWDPVENAALMPWLVTTALLHALAVNARSGKLSNWSLVLAQAAFCLSLLGFFLVRSGLLISVHAFATDPWQGGFLLTILLLASSAPIVLWIYRLPSVRDTPVRCLRSRETLMFAAILLLLAGCATVFLGTLYPLLHPFLGWGRISVGSPYFNQMGLLWMTPLLLLVLLMPFSRWPSATTQDKRTGRFESRRHIIAHGGVLFFALGVLGSGYATEEHTLQISPGNQVELPGLSLHWQATSWQKEKNFVALQAHFLLIEKGKQRLLVPEKRRYALSPLWMSETALASGWLHDVRLSLGTPVAPDQLTGPWTVRIEIKPLMNAIWLGMLLMTLGGLPSLWRSSLKW